MVNSYIAAQLRRYSTFFKRVRNIIIVCTVMLSVLQVGLYTIGISRETYAQQQQPSRALKQLHQIVYGDVSSYDDATKELVGTLGTVTCGLTGYLCTDDLNAPQRESSVMASISGWVITPLTHPPASGVYWASQTLSDAGFVPKTYAQGIGFTALGSFQTIWKAMRDLVYLLLVLVVVASGFIIMFNVPVGDKGSVTMEAMLPRLVITLILISLSYGIAGFLIDIMYLMIYMTISVFIPLIPSLRSDASLQQQLFSSVSSGRPYDLFMGMITGRVGDFTYHSLAESIYLLMPEVVRRVLNAIATEMGLIVLLKGFSSAFGALGGLGNKAFSLQYGREQLLESIKQSKLLNKIKVGSTISSVVDGSFAIENTKTTIVSILMMVIILAVVNPISEALGGQVIVYLLAAVLALSAFLLSIRLLFALIEVYIQIIIAVMFAPLFIMLNALPGSNAFVDWLKNLAINLLCFPIAIALILVCSFIASNAGTGAIWAPPYLNSLSEVGGFQMLVAGVLFYNIPTLLSTVKQSLGYKSTLSLPVMSSMFAPVTAIVGGVLTARSKMLDLGKGAKSGPFSKV